MPELKQTLHSAGVFGGEHSSRERADRIWWLVAAIAFALFLAFSIGYCLTRSPWWDEGLFADVAMNVRNSSRFGNTVLAPHGFLNWPGVHQYTYWQFPLYLLAEGIWIRLFPPTIQWMRLLSVAFGCLYLISWFLFVRGITRNGNLALFITSVVALDYAVIFSASDGRMEMMCAALGFAGLASYVSLRVENPKLAIILAGFFGACSLFCHPMGLVTNVGLFAVILLLDRRRIPWSAVPVAATFYLIGAGLCVRYALEAPRIYAAQSAAAVAYRESSLTAVLHHIATDCYYRYYSYYLGGLTGVNKLKSFSLLFGVIGFFVVAATARLRSQYLGKLLLLLALLSYIGVAAIDNQDNAIYFIYTTPFLTACGALWVYDEWFRARGIGRMIASGFLLAAIASSLGAFAVKIHQNGLKNQYMVAVDVIKRNLPPGAILDGGSELGLALGFGPHIIDDRYLGYWSRAELPAVYAEDRYYVGLPQEQTAWDASRLTLAEHYHPIFRNEEYKVYLRNDLPARQ